jgi:hypothetical protein
MARMTHFERTIAKQQGKCHNKSPAVGHVTARVFFGGCRAPCGFIQIGFICLFIPSKKYSDAIKRLQMRSNASNRSIPMGFLLQVIAGNIYN